MFRRLQDSINRALDFAVRPRMHVVGKERPSFQICGFAGLLAAVGLSMALVLAQGLSPWIQAAVILSCLATFLVLAIAVKILSGEENLVYYHHEVAMIAVVAILLWLLDQPVLAYLAPTLLGIGACLACGRIGCLMVGCCHGRPHRWGVRYRSEHADGGCPDYLVGVRLLPIQAIESLWVLGAVAVGSFLVLRGQPGAALAWHVIAYDGGRFFFEFVRGDVGRPYWRGFSEAQWVSILRIALVVAAGVTGILPFQAWHGVVLATLILTMAAVAAGRSKDHFASHRLCHSEHVQELAEILDQIDGGEEIRVGCTSLGLYLSTGEMEIADQRIRHYSLSARDAEFGEAAARLLSDLIRDLRHPAGQVELIARPGRIFHLLVSSSSSAG